MRAALRSRVEHRSGEAGAVAILVAVLTTALFVTAALVVDLGLARDLRGQAQVTADASALAAANVLYPESGTCTAGQATSPCLTDAVNQAKTYALNNMNIEATDWTAAGNGCSVPSGYVKAPSETTACITFDSLTQPKYVKVSIPFREMKTGLGALADVNEINVRAAARAVVASTSQGKCALCFLGPVSVGNGDFDIRGSSVHVNGNLEIGAQSYWTAAHVYVAGTWSAGDTSRITPDPELAQTITDPFATDTRFPPSVTGLATKPANTSPCNNGPGIYGAYTWGANEGNGSPSPCVLSPGLYVVDGMWQLKNNSGIRGTNVTIFVRNGSLDFKNSGNVRLTAPTATTAASTPSGDIPGFVIVYNRPSTAILGLQGNGTTTNDGSGCSSGGTASIDGGIYAPNALLSVNGTSCLSVNAGPIIVKSVDPCNCGDFNGNKSGLNLTNGSEISIDNLPKGIALDQ